MNYIKGTALNVYYLVNFIFIIINDFIIFLYNFKLNLDPKLTFLHS
jgi:hypothetical protein